MASPSTTAQHKNKRKRNWDAAAVCEDAHIRPLANLDDSVSSRKHKTPCHKDAGMLLREAHAGILRFSIIDKGSPLKHLQHPAMVPPKKGQCPLLAVCPEIRDRVFEYLLVSPSIVSERTHGDLYSRLPGQTKRGDLLPAQVAIPSICQTSRLLREESLAVLFGRNRFLLNEAITTKWLWRFSDDVLEHMRQIRLDYYFAGPQWWSMGLASHHSTPKPPRQEYTVVCDIALTGCEPWFVVSIVCEPTEKWSVSTPELKTKVDEMLQGTLTAATGRSFNRLHLRKLWEHYTLWSIALVGEGKMEQGMVNRVLARTFRHDEGSYSAKDLELLAAFKALEQPKCSVVVGGVMM